MFAINEFAKQRVQLALEHGLQTAEYKIPTRRRVGEEPKMTRYQEFRERITLDPGSGPSTSTWVSIDRVTASRSRNVFP